MTNMITLRINEEMKQKMKALNHINWSALIRKSIEDHLEREFYFNKKIAKNASEKIDQMRNSNSFIKKDKEGTEIIREWRNKRK